MLVKFSRLCLLAAFLVLGFVVCEAALRLKGGSEADTGFRNLFMPDARIGGVRLRPGARTHFKTSEFETDIAINSQGVRDDEIGPKAANERRIVVLGDSMVMAAQVPVTGTFCRQLQQALNAGQPPGGSRYRVINAGVQGYGPVEEVLFFQHVVQDLKPDVVLLTLYVANDAVEAAAGIARLHGAAPAKPAVTKVSDTARLWLRRSIRRTIVLQILRQRALDVLGRFQNDAKFEVPPAIAMYEPVPSSNIDRGLAATRECVERIAAIAADRGATTGVILMPARFQVSDEAWEGTRNSWAESNVVLERDAATQRFRAALAGLPVPVFDALPSLRSWPNHEEVYFRGAGHLTAIGHRALATGLERFVTSSSLLDIQRVSPVAAVGR